MTATQGPTASAVFGATITTAAWRTKPSWCVIASNDRAVPPELEKAEAAAMKATSITVPSSHVPMLSQWIGSIDISMKKAYTSRAFDIETKELAKHSQSGGEFFGIHVSNNGKIMIFAGGIPLKLDGKVVGAIGVSGSGDQDHAVAAAGAAAF